MKKVKKYRKKSGKNNTSESADGNVLTVTHTYYATRFDEEYYLKDAVDVLTSTNTYWIAARNVFAKSDYAYFGLRCASNCISDNSMFHSTGNTGSNKYSLRPVVSLSLDILGDDKIGNDENGYVWNLKSNN